MVSRTVGGVSTALTWDVTSSLVESNGQGGHVVYAYDASGQRVVQARVADANRVGTASAYVASGQVDDPNTAATSTGDLSATRYYTFGGSTVAMRTNDNKLSLMLGDEQGSTNVMMPVTVQTDGTLAKATLADAAASTRTSYTPYGQLRGADNLATDRGWLGQVEDRVVGTGATSTGTGLTYLNARYYDPATSRFISPDPLMNPGDPKTLDPYRYADNNPVVATDASGLAACYGLSAANEKACMSSYNAGSGYTPPAAGPHMPAPAKPKAPATTSASPKSPIAFQSAVDYGFSSMAFWMQSSEAKSILSQGSANPQTFNEVLSGAIGFGSSNWKHPKWWWNAASLSSFLVDDSGVAAIGAGETLSAMFPDKGPWDVKVPLGKMFGFDKTSPASDPSWGQLSMAGGGTMFYDVVGNFQYGIMMHDFRVRQDVAVSASHVSTAGNPDPEDDPLIGLGYQFREAYPGAFTADDMYEYLTSPDTLAVLEDTHRYKPPSN
jgi:RHS repeat-associated protein